MVPLWVQGADAPAAGGRVLSTLVDLPVGEPSPALRLQHVAHAMREHTTAEAAAVVANVKSAPAWVGT